MRLDLPADPRDLLEEPEATTKSLKEASTSNW